MKEALALCKVKPLVIDYDDPEYSGPGERLGAIEYEEFVAQGDPDFAWTMPDDEWDAIALNYTSGTTGDPKGVVYHHRGANLLATGNVITCSMGKQRCICGRCRCSTATAGASRGRSRWWPARMCACARCARQRCSTRSPSHKVTHLCGAPIVMSTLLNAPDEREEAAAACGGVFHRRRSAARGRARRHEGGRLQRHASLRADRKLRSRGGERLACRMGCAAARRTGGEESAPGRALRRARRDRRDGPGDDGAGAARRRDDRRSDDARQCGDEGLSQEQEIDRKPLSRAAGFIPATSA